MLFWCQNISASWKGIKYYRDKKHIKFKQQISIPYHRLKSVTYEFIRFSFNDDYNKINRITRCNAIYSQDESRLSAIQSAWNKEGFLFKNNCMPCIDINIPPEIFYI